MKVCLSAGGTGGHIYPAIAFGEACLKRDWEVIYVGNASNMEGALTKKHGIAFRGISAKSITGNPVQKLYRIGLQVFSIVQSLGILLKEKPDIVIGFGGFVTAPIVIASYLLKIPVLLHEQNAIPGKANLKLQSFAKGVVTCYPTTESLFRIKTRFLGNPRATIASENKKNPYILNQLNLDESKPLVLIVMGSLGSLSVNEILIEFSKLVEHSPDIQYVIVLGRRFYTTMIEKFSTSTHVHVIDYVEQIDLLPYVDVMVARAGATSAAEMLAMGVPSILIPSPFVPNDHQRHNALVLEQSHASMMLEEKDLDAQTLKSKIESLVYHPQIKEQMSINARKLAKPHAIEEMMAWVEDMVKS